MSFITVDNLHFTKNQFTTSDITLSNYVDFDEDFLNYIFTLTTHLISSIFHNQKDLHSLKRFASEVKFHSLMILQRYLKLKSYQIKADGYL